MPFQSSAQMKFMFAKHPEIAKRWVSEGSPTKGLPEHKANKRKILDTLKKRRSSKRQ